MSSQLTQQPNLPNPENQEEYNSALEREAIKLITKYDWKIIRVDMKTEGTKRAKTPSYPWGTVKDKEASLQCIGGIKNKPYQGIAVAVAQSDLWVLDIDPPKPGEKDGMDYMDCFFKFNNIDYYTSCLSKTPSGGLHYFFKADPSIRQTQKLSLPAFGKFPAGRYSVDIRAKGLKEDGAGGYIVLSPSYNYDKNDFYEWEVSPYQLPPQEAPQSLLNLIVAGLSGQPYEGPKPEFVLDPSMIVTPSPKPELVPLPPSEPKKERKKRTPALKSDVIDDEPEPSNSVEVLEKVEFAVECWKIKRKNPDTDEEEFITRDDWIGLGMRLKMLGVKHQAEGDYKDIWFKFSKRGCEANPNWKVDLPDWEYQWNSFRFDLIEKPCSEIFFWAAKGSPKKWFARYPKRSFIRPIPEFALVPEMCSLIFGPEADAAQAVSIAMKPYLRFVGGKKIIFYDVEEKLWHITSEEKVFYDFLKNVLLSICEKVRFYLSTKKPKTKADDEKLENLPSIMAGFKTRAKLSCIFDMLPPLLQDLPELRDSQGKIVEEKKITQTKIEAISESLFDEVFDDRMKNGNKSTVTFNTIREDVGKMTLQQRLNSHPGTEHLLPHYPGMVTNLKTGECFERKAEHFFRWEYPFDPRRGTQEGVKAMANIYFDTFEDKEFALHQWMEHGSFFTGESPNATFYNYIGPSGSNGKSLITNTLTKLSGMFCYTCSSEAIIKQGIKSGGDKPRPDRLMFLGKRLSIIPEIPEGSELDADFMKKLSGPDFISYRDLHQGADNYLTFRPVCKTVLVSNFSVKFNANDGGVLRRAKYRKFNVKFVDGEPMEPNERKKDLDLERKIDLHSAMLFYVQGAMNWYKRGSTLVEPQCCIDAKVEFVEEIDYMTQFLHNHIRFSGTSDPVKISDIYTVFKNTGVKNLTNVAFGKEFKAAIMKTYHRKTAGYTNPETDEPLGDPFPVTVTDATVKGAKIDKPGEIHFRRSSGATCIQGIRLMVDSAPTDVSKYLSF